ncbi:MAG TPA: DUF5996 family protein [Candidatus Kapabacteria bacterium]|nr:DUF5996 family protein [Candidatus Kapabacteria bacterium]
MEHEFWPSLPYEDWLDTCETLHLYTQIPGKIKLALSPPLNEWWHVAYGIWARGITTGPIPFEHRIFEIRFDFVSHIVEIHDNVGKIKTIELKSRTVAEFYHLVMSELQEMGIVVTITPAPQEMGSTIPIATDRTHRSYDRDAVNRFWTILSQVSGVFEQFRSGFSGKSSPVQFWWGSFDLAIARYCGRPCNAGPHANRMERIGGDEEHFAAGFWPGDGRLKRPAFYAYRYPALPELQHAPLQPREAYWNTDLGEWILHYDDVRRSPLPEQAILEFLTSTYESVANLSHWDRAFLERKIE